MRTLLVTSLCIILWCSVLDALVVDKHVTLRSLLDFEQFGFAENGTVSIVASTPINANVSIFICQDKEFDRLGTYQVPEEPGFCVVDPKMCEYTSDYDTDGRISIDNYKVKTRNRYHLVAAQCGSRDVIDISVQYTLLNPGGEQLPVGLIPLPDLYILITSIWTILVGISIFIYFRNREHVVKLHTLLILVLVLKLAVVIVAMCYWHVYKSAGVDVVQLKYLQSFIYAFSETAFFCALLLISKGWRITRISLPSSEIRTISVALVLLLSTLLFFSFYNDGYYFLSLMIMYFFMLPKIFTSITRNTRALHTHMLLARYGNVEMNSAPILYKIHMFKTLRTAVILYLGSILIISSMKIIMWWFLVWVTYCVSEIVTIVMVVSVCYVTRPRQDGVFSPRSYFEGGAFPILNMQQFDHFDELFGDQIWDPDLVIAGGAAENAASGHPIIDMTSSLVIEYPMPNFPMDETKANYFPRLAIATLVKKEKGREREEGRGEQETSEKSKFSLRRRTLSNSSSSLLNSSTTSLLAPSSPSTPSSPRPPSPSLPPAMLLSPDTLDTLPTPPLTRRNRKVFMSSDDDVSTTGQFTNMESPVKEDKGEEDSDELM